MTMRLVASLLHLQRGQLHLESPVIFSSLEKCSRQSCIAVHTYTLTPLSVSHHAVQAFIQKLFTVRCGYQNAELAK